VNQLSLISNAPNILSHRIEERAYGFEHFSLATDLKTT
jgi:hypothetical protein